MDVFQLRIIVGLVMLSVSSGLDIWKREIHDFYWLVFGAITVIISVLAFDQLNIATLLYSLIIVDRKSTRLNSSHSQQSRMPSSA